MQKKSLSDITIQANRQMPHHPGTKGRAENCTGKTSPALYRRRSQRAERGDAGCCTCRFVSGRIFFLPATYLSDSAACFATEAMLMGLRMISIVPDSILEMSRIPLIRFVSRSDSSLMICRNSCLVCCVILGSSNIVSA